MKEALSALSPRTSSKTRIESQQETSLLLVSPEDWTTNSWLKNFFGANFSRNEIADGIQGKTRHSLFSKIKSKIRNFILNLD